MDDKDVEDPRSISSPRGMILGGCRLEERVGRGGMGSVYRALDLARKQPVAVKILSPFLASEPAVLARFNREARAASKVRHPNIVRLFTTSSQDGLHFTVMEFVDGHNLAEVVKRQGKLPFAQAVEIGCDIASGLEALHAAGIVHRDIKPSNVLLGRAGGTKITDFGIARDVSELHRLTATGDLLGTAGFAAPEQYETSTVDGRADLYSLGATLHYALTGSRPPADPRLPFAPLGDEIPSDIRALLSRLLAPDPDARPSQARAVLEILARYRPHRQASGTGLRRIDGGLRVLAILLAGVLIFSAGTLAADGRWKNPGCGVWDPLLPPPDRWWLPALLLAMGVLTSAPALIGIPLRQGFHVRSIAGLAFFAAFVLLVYVAGAATGAATLVEAAGSVLDCTPGSLAFASVLSAASGILLGVPRQSSVRRQLAAGALLLTAMGLAALSSSACSTEDPLAHLSGRLSSSLHAWLSAGTMMVSLGLLFFQHANRIRPSAIILGVFVSLSLLCHAGVEGGISQFLEALNDSSGTLIIATLLALGAWAVRPCPSDRRREPFSKTDGTSLTATPS